MKTLKYTFLIILIPLLMNTSCSKDNKEPDLYDFVFTYRTSCGWCGGTHELKIDDVNASYEYFAVCDNEPLYAESTLTKKEVEALQLEELLAIVKEMDLDDCGVGVDGCDTSLIFLQNETEYFIRFEYSSDTKKIDSYLPPIIELFEKLEQEAQVNNWEL